MAGIDDIFRHIVEADRRPPGQKALTNKRISSPSTITSSSMQWAYVSIKMIGALSAEVDSTRLIDTWNDLELPQCAMDMGDKDGLRPAWCVADMGEVVAAWMIGTDDTDQAYAQAAGYARPQGSPFQGEYWINKLYYLQGVTCARFLAEKYGGSRRFVLSGHSYGGAVALAVGWYMANTMHIKAEVLTFGSPMIGSGTIAYQCHRCKPFRWMNAGDYVPRVPALTSTANYNYSFPDNAINRVHWEQPEYAVLIRSDLSVSDGEPRVFLWDPIQFPVPRDMSDSFVGNRISPHYIKTYDQTVSAVVDAYGGYKRGSGGVFGPAAQLRPLPMSPPPLVPKVVSLTPIQRLVVAPRPSLHIPFDVSQISIFGGPTTMAYVPPDFRIKIRKMGKGVYYARWMDRSIASGTRAQMSSLAKGGNRMLNRIMAASIIDTGAFSDALQFWFGSANTGGLGFQPDTITTGTL